MENTTENKARFEALYIFQPVLKVHNFEKLAIEILTPQRIGKQNTFLSLRSISILTDEEKDFISKKMQWYPEDVDVWIQDDVMHQDYGFTDHVKLCDILRYIGILIPWMDLSVEQIIEYGWAKEDTSC